MKCFLKIYFCDFWDGFNPGDLSLFQVLCKNYTISITNVNPDIVFYSLFFHNEPEFSNYPNSTLVLISGENVEIDFSLCDYAISGDIINNDRYLRIPLYLLENKRFSKEKIENIKHKEIPTKFCNFLYSNNNFKSTEIRNDFFKKISQYKFVDSGGLLFNNLGYKVENKLDFIKDYKFTIAFENSSYKGYTTEKITDAFNVGSIPIYWGNPLISEEFNNKSFINCHDFDSFDNVIKKVIEVDSDDKLYIQMKNTPILLKNSICNNYEKLIFDFLEKIINSPFPLGSPILKYYRMKGIKFDYAISKMIRHRSYGYFTLNDYCKFGLNRLKKIIKKI